MCKCFFKYYCLQAYANLVDNLGWKSLVILYENEDSLVKLQEVLKLPISFDSVKITMRQLYTNTDDFRPLLKEIKKSGETRIILVSLDIFYNARFRGGFHKPIYALRQALTLCTKLLRLKKLLKSLAQSVRAWLEPKWVYEIHPQAEIHQSLVQ